MGRKPLVRVDCFPYHVVARSNNKEWFYAPPGKMWQTFEFHLARIQKKFEVQIHAFVMMSNHFHLLITTPQSNLDIAMKHLLGDSSRSLNRSLGRINHLFGGPYKWSLIRNASHYEHALKYVYRNPVKAGMCLNVEDYAYSTLTRRVTKFEISKSALECEIRTVNDIEWLAWLNHPYTAAEHDCLRRALRRKEFELIANKHSRNLPAIFRVP